MDVTATPSSPALDALLANVGWVHALARQLCADVHVAADAAQAACVAATRQPPRDVSKVRSYLARLLRNVLSMERRGASRRVRREQAVATGAAAVAPSACELVERAELQQGLVAAVLALPAPQRELVLRHYFDGESVADIARLLGRSPDAVQAQLRRARERLRLDLDRRGMLHAVLALPAPFAGTAVWPAALITGGIIMQGKLALAGAGVVAAVGLWWLSSGSPDLGTVPERPPTPVTAAQATTGSVLSSNDGSQAAAGAQTAPAPVREAVPLPVQVRGRLVGLHPRLRWTTPLALHTTWHDGAIRGSREDDAEVDADGSFRFVLPAEVRSASLRIVVKAADAAYVPVVQSLDVAATQAEELQVAVTPAPVVLGQVVDASGEPVAGATVLLFAAVDGVPKRGEQARRETAADGTFRLSLGEPQQHLVVALPPGGRADLLPAGTLFTRTEPAVELAPLVAATAVHVTGSVRWSSGAPVARAEVEWRGRSAVDLDEESGIGWYADGTLTRRSRTATDEAGRFLLPARQGETAMVFASRIDGCQPAEYNNMKRATAPQDVELSIAGRPVTIEVLADGQPAGVADVQWRREGKIHIAANFDTDDRGVLRQIVLDESLRIRAVSTDGTRSSEWHAFPKGPPEHVVLELLPADGVPVAVAIDGVALAQVHFVWRPIEGGSARSMRATAVEGRFALRLPPGRYRVSLQAEAGTTSEYLVPAETEVAVPAGGGDVRIRAELGGCFRLSVTDSGGAFVAGHYRVLRGGVPYASPQRTRDGELLRNLLPARGPRTSDVLPVGEYEVVVDLGPRGEYRSTVTITPSETAEVRIRLR